KFAGADKHGEQPAPGNNGHEKLPVVKSPKDAAQEQDNIRGKLGDIVRDMGSGSSNLPQQFAKADQAMKAAENALKGGDAHGSVPQQKEALDQLQKAEDEAIQEMAKSLQAMLTFGFGAPDGGGYGDGFDPLGRENGQGPNNIGVIKLPDE